MNFKIEKTRIPKHLLKYFEVDFCSSCYICHILEICQEIKRVLSPSGVFFLNIGDSYISGKSRYSSKSQTISGNKDRGDVFENKPDQYYHPFLKDKDLALIPQRLAVALQEQGWWVRSIIIWHKPNPMPESVSGWRFERHRIKVKSGNQIGKGKQSENILQHGFNERWDNPEECAQWQDCPGCEVCSPNDGLVLRKGSWRPTEAHEYILMLTKSGEYYSDGEAVREPQKLVSLARLHRAHNSPYEPGFPLGKQNHISDYYKITEGKSIAEIEELVGGRNLRSVWEFSTANFNGQHFACFPQKLPELCIKASTSEEGHCSKCGKQLVRVVEHKNMIINRSNHAEESGIRIMSSGTMVSPSESKTLGFRPQCQCKASTEPDIVLDPFCGSGTTLAVAKRLGRKSIGFELSEDYCKLAVKRVEAEMSPMVMV